MCTGLCGAVVSSGSDGMQERQRHSGSVISLGDMRVSGGDGSLGFCVLCFCAVGGSSKSDGMQERQRHRRSVSRLRSVSVSGAAGGLRVSVMGVCAVGGSSKRGVAGKERLSARASVKLR